MEIPSVSENGIRSNNDALRLGRLRRCIGGTFLPKDWLGNRLLETPGREMAAFSRLPCKVYDDSFSVPDVEYMSLGVQSSVLL